MKGHAWSFAAPFGVIALAASCGGDGGPTEIENNISEAEAMAVFAEVLSAVFTVGFSTGSSVADGQAGAASDEIIIDATAACDGGGTIAVSGRFAFDIDGQGSGSGSYDLTETPSDCSVTTGTGVTYRVNGDPNIHMAGSYSYSQGAPQGTFDMSFSGGLNWTATNGGASGSCRMDLVYAFDWGTSHGSVTGTICGYEINQQY